MAPSKDASAKDRVTCTACSAPVESGPVEKAIEPVFHRTFELYACPNCEVTFTRPQDDFPLQEWYAKASYLYGEVEYSVRATAENDWRFRRFDQLARRYGLRGRLLDVGCGDGRFLVQQKRWGWTGSLKGVDFSSEMTRRSESECDIELAPLQSFIERNANNPFDVVVLFDVLEHFPIPAQTILELKKLIRQGGTLLVTVPNTRRIRFFVREEYDFPPNHFTRWTAEALSGLMRRAGLEVVEVKTSYFSSRMIAEQLFYPLFWRALPLVKKLLFGAQASGGKTLTELLEQNQAGTASGGVKGLIGSKGARKQIETILRVSFTAVTFPIFAPACWFINLFNARAGDHLLVMSRRPA